MFSSKRFFIIIIFILLLSVMHQGCKKKSVEPLTEVKGSEADEKTYLTKGKNIRKNGNVSIKVNNIETTKIKLKENISEYKAQILEENISVNDDSSLIIRYKIKIKSEYFSEMIDKISNLGHLLGINIEAEDVSDDLSQQTDKIDLLRQRLNQAKQSKNAKLIDSLQSELNDAQHEKKETKKTILYSYINATIYESAHLSHAISLGYYYGKEGFIWVVKILIIVMISIIPALIIFLIIKIILALVKWRWKRLIQMIENIGKGNIKKISTDEKNKKSK